MKRLITAFNTEKNYEMFCEILAEDTPENRIDDVAKQTIESIQTQNFLSDFEKIVRDYFNEKGIELSYYILANDIKKYLND